MTVLMKGRTSLMALLIGMATVTIEPPMVYAAPAPSGSGPTPVVSLGGRPRAVTAPVPSAAAPPPGQLIVPEDIYATDIEQGNVVSRKEITNPDSDFYEKRGTFENNSPRDRALANAARGVGIRAGFAYEARRLNNILETIWTPVLNRNFPFSSLMLRQGTIVPPVITQIHGVEETSGDRYLYLTIGAYEIVKDARVAIRTPTWRDYLFLPVSDPRPPQGLVAKTGEEKDLWAKAADEGWDKGITEARDTFALNLNIMVRDFEGMRRYRDLQAQGVVSLPDVSTRRARYRVTDDGRRAFVGEEAIRIMVSPKFRGRPPAGWGR